MPYPHYGRIGDVWKHLPLCSILALERPRHYVETHSAAACHELQGSPEQAYGVGHFLARAAESPLLRDSAYTRLLQELNPEGPPRRYLGSPGLALSLLKDCAESFRFFDLEGPPLENIRGFAAGLGLAAKVATRQEDSIPAVHRLLDGLDGGAFLHIDPYAILAPGADGLSSLELFLAAARRGIRCLLWYGFETERERLALHGQIGAALAAAGDWQGRASVHGVELRLEAIQADRVAFNPGVLGCGIVDANLGQESRDSTEELARELVGIYQGSRVYGIHPGDLALETLRL